MEVAVFLIAVVLVAAGWAIWLSRHRRPTADDPREVARAEAEAERTRSAAYCCSHLPIDNPRISSARGGY